LLLYSNVILKFHELISLVPDFIRRFWRENFCLSKEPTQLNSKLNNDNNIPVRVDVICPWNTLHCLHKHPIYHSFGSFLKVLFLTIYWHQLLGSIDSNTKLLNRHESEYNGTSLPHLSDAAFSARKKIWNTNHSQLVDLLNCMQNKYGELHL